jgi:HEAT repeat protein
MVNWSRYLESLCNTYAQWWKFGTLKDVVEPESVESEPSTLPFEFGLMVQTVERDAQQRSKEEQKVERLSVLEGLRKYASEHVLLVGRPGSGKSTALVRLLVATAQQARQNPHSLIPVLVELRTYKVYYKTSVLDLVQASLKRRKLRLNLESLEDELAEGRFLLLMDGINELPDDEARTTIKEFRLDYSDVYYAAERLLKFLTSPPTPLLGGEGSKIVPPFPRREGGLGGLGLSDETLKREYLNYLKWTEPLALMLELVEDEKNKKQAVRVVRLALEVDLRLGARLAGAVKPKWQEKTIDLVTIREISQQLKMLLLGITRSYIAIDILSQALEHRDSSVRWFTTEALGQIVSEATIPALKRAIQDEDNSVRWAAFNALEKIGTEAIIPALSQATKDENPMICEQAIYLLGDIAREAAIPYLIEALAKEDNSVRGSALCILGQICGKDTIPELIQDLEDRGFDVHSGAFSVIRLWHGIAFFPRGSIAYGRVGYNNTIYCYAKRMCQSDTIPVLCQKLADEDPNVRKTAVYMLGKIGTDQAIHALCQALDNKDSIVRRDAVHWLGQVRRETGTKTVFPCLLQALEDEDSDVRGYASYVLEQIGIPELLPNLFEMS